MKKILFTCILFLGLTMTGFAQSAKMKEKATEKVEQLNAEIVAGDKSLALSDAQKEQIYNLHIERLQALKKVNKDGGDKAAKKEVNQKYNQKIYKEILTKKQKKARKAGKEKVKN
ncbi:hypothetical protein [Psychroserpens sp. SPM9]|uniref:hypothetical protein n=1 Tax=Psychroserpens sp. SPM9 TaxID=2975598 RepID=UPI0021A909F1|nr:hypothetical protein [Psychroserpens sp. SPM9]MDG5490067.1 hypothetical protein [Psychroserpens sp. SPM9]